MIELQSEQARMLALPDGSIRPDTLRDQVADAFDQFPNGFYRVTCRPDGRQGLQVNIARDDALFPFAHDQPRVVDHDGDDRNVRLDGHIEYALFELLQQPVV